MIIIVIVIIIIPVIQVSCKWRRNGFSIGLKLLWLCSSDGWPAIWGEVIKSCGREVMRSRDRDLFIDSPSFPRLEWSAIICCYFQDFCLFLSIKNDGFIAQRILPSITFFSPSIHPSFCLSILPSIDPSIFPAIHPSISLFIHLSK